MTTATHNRMISARERIRFAFSPQLFGTAGTHLLERLSEHLQTVQNSNDVVLNWQEPLDAIADATQFLAKSSGYRIPFCETRSETNCETNSEEAGSNKNHSADEMVSQAMEPIRRLIEEMLSRGHNLHDPRYIGHQVPAPVPLAGLFDALAGITNQVGAVYEMGPWVTATEQALLNSIGELAGWTPGEFAGVVTQGGSLANLTALLTARNVVLGDCWETGVPAGSRAPVLVAHGEAHYSVSRSAGILGLGTNQVRYAALDEKRRICPQELDKQLAELKAEQRPIIAVSICACATPTGAFDPIEPIAAVCRKHDVWLHVDAAHGGAVLFSEQHRHLLAGLELADSFIIDAHKMMFVPALCAFVFYRNKEHRAETFQQRAPYLFDPSAPDITAYDAGLTAIECTRRATSFGLWGIWTLFGPQLFADMVDVTFDLGQTFYQQLTDADDFEPLHEPESNILVFRYFPAKIVGQSDETIGRFQFELRRKLIESGEFYIVQTQKEGIGALRVTIVNPLTTPEILQQLLETLRRFGDELLAESF